MPERGGRRRAAASARLTTSWLACGWRRTRRSSISSWPNVAPAPERRTPARRRRTDVLPIRDCFGPSPSGGRPDLHALAATGRGRGFVADRRGLAVFGP